MQAISVWRHKAACKEQRELFELNPKAAKKLCIDCPVADQCLRYALVYEEFGIWGGTTRKSREQLVQDQPLIRLNLIQEAMALGVYEYRYSVEQYQKTLQEARDRLAKLVPVRNLLNWEDPDTWQFPEE
jgi:WhiB family redox-sensing transcriptional regulator